MDRLLDITTLVSLMLLVMVLFSVRGSHIRVEYSVSWLAASVALLALSRMRGPLRAFSHWLLIVGSGLLLLFFRFSVIVSKLRDDNIALAQRVAILEFHLNALRESSQEISQA
jgi:hypothetical protein